MGASSVQVPDIQNHPTVGMFVFEQQEFFKRTKRIDYEGNALTLDGGVIGQKKGDKIANRGIISEMRFHLDLEMELGGTSPVVHALENWLDGLLQAVTIKANNTELVQASGIHLADLRLIDGGLAEVTHGYGDVEEKDEPSGDGAHQLYAIVVVPLAVNRASVGGAVFAESNNTFLSYRLEFDAADQLYTMTGTSPTATWSGTVTPVVTCWSIPYVPTSKGLLAVLPDLRYHAMIGSRREYLTGSGDKRLAFSTAHGSMERMIWRVRSDSDQSWYDPLEQGDNVKFRYGQNQGLREQSVRDLMFLNIRWYGQKLNAGGLAIDFMAENSQRDTVVPDLFLDMEIVYRLKADVPMETGDYVDICECAVIENEVWAAASPMTGAAGAA